MERDLTVLVLSISFDNFNSHAHVERDERRKKINAKSEISTHTLTWSVTSMTVVTQLSPQISTHTLTWSVTSTLCIKRGIYIISTHTLTWSVTLQVFANFNIILYFNSHAHVERD